MKDNPEDNPFSSKWTDPEKRNQVRPVETQPDPDSPGGCIWTAFAVVAVIAGLLLFGGYKAFNAMFGGDGGSGGDDYLCSQIVEGAAGEDLTDEMIARRYKAWENAGCNK